MCSATCAGSTPRPGTGRRGGGAGGRSGPRCRRHPDPAGARPVPRDHLRQTRGPAAAGAAPFGPRPTAAGPPQLSERALATARKLDDPETLAACLLARHDALWIPGRAAERIDVAREIAELAERTGDAERHAEGLLLTANALLEEGSAAFRAALCDFLPGREAVRPAPPRLPGPHPPRRPRDDRRPAGRCRRTDRPGKRPWRAHRGTRHRQRPDVTAAEARPGTRRTCPVTRNGR